MIILDLEWNRGYDNKPLEEILQIGAVRLERMGGPIVDTFNVCIRPCVHKRFNRAAKALPELEAYRLATTSFREAWASFQAWCGEETEFAGWGGDDFTILRQNCAYWKLPAPKLPIVYDLQAAFSLLLGSQQQLALWWAAEYCQIPDTFTFHNALNDAVYTALVSAFIPERLKDLIALPVKIWQFAQQHYPTQPVADLGPYPTLEALLSNPACRRPACPICGQRTMLQAWNYTNREQYFAAFRCPGHGRFICRLTPRQAQDGSWQGELTVPDISIGLLKAYAAASKIFHCKARRKSHRKSKRRCRSYRNKR